MPFPGRRTLADESIGSTLRGLFFPRRKLAPAPAPAPAPAAPSPDVGPTAAKGMPSFSPDFFASQGGRRMYWLGDVPSSEAEAVNRTTAFAAALYAYVAMKYRAEKYSEPGIFVAELDDNGDVGEWVPGHPLEQLLDLPHPDIDMGEMLRITRLYRDFSGSCLWLKETDRVGRLARLTPFSGDEFTVEPALVDGVSRIHGRFKINVRGGTPVERGPDDVVYFRETSIYSWSRGLAPLDAALGMLNLGVQATNTVRSILRNALFPSVIIQADPAWQPTDPEYEKWQAALDQYAQLERKGAPLALTGGGKATRVSLTLKDLIPDDILDRVEASTAAAFGIPAVVLGFLVGLKNSPWSQMAEARRMAYEDTIEPMWRRDAKALTQRLLLGPAATGKRPPESNTNRVLAFDTASVRALQADQFRTAEIAEKNAAWWTVDEGRQYTGKDPLPEGDPRKDVIPGLQAAAAPAETGAEEEGTEEAPPEKRAPRTTPASRAAAAARMLKVARQDRWKLWEARVGGMEFSWELAAGEQLLLDRALVLELAGKHLRTRKADEQPVDPESVRRMEAALDAELPELQTRWKGAMAPQVQATARASVQLVGSQVGLSFEVLEPSVLEYTAKHAATLVKQVSETTRDEVRAALRAGLEAGEGIPKITARLTESGTFAPSRAKLIARTETTAVSNQAGRQALHGWGKANGQRIVKGWLATQDARTRDEHRELDGEERPIGKEFSNGRQEPGEPNCRCTLEYRIEEEDEA